MKISVINFLKSGKWGLVFLLILMLNSCQMQDLVVGAPDYLRVKELNRKNIVLQIKMPVENPNNFGFTLKAIDMDVFVNNQKIGTVKKTNKVKIKANSSKIYTIDFEIKPSDLLGGAFGLIRDLRKNKVDLEIKGYIKAQKFLISKKIKIENKQEVKIY